MSNLSGDISKRIRALKDWSQQELADRLQVSRNYVALIETGAKKPSVRLLHQMEQLLTTVDKENSGGPTDQARSDTAARAVAVTATGGTADALRNEARRQFDYIISATRDDPARLGWVVEQLRIHLRKPETWEEPETPEQIAARLGLPTMGKPSRHVETGGHSIPAPQRKTGTQ